MSQTMHEDPPASRSTPIVNALKRSRSRWRIFAFVAVGFVLVALTVRVASGGPDQAGADGIARVGVEGVIATSAGRTEALADLGEDDAVKAVIVAINSPGGTTAGGEELYESLSRLSERKPVVAVVSELGASAAYMTAIGTDRIFARRLSLVGSIGVLYQHVDAGELMRTVGVDFDKVASGELKAEPDFDEPLEGAARESLQRLVDDSFSWFLDIVAEERGLTQDEALAVADGRILNGRDAMEAGLIDAFGGEHEARAWLESEHGLEEDLPIRAAWPRPVSGLERLTRVVGGDLAGMLGLDGAAERARAATLDGLVSLWHANR